MQHLKYILGHFICYKLLKYKENNVFPIKYMYTGVRIKTILTLTLILTFLHVAILIVIKRLIYSNIPVIVMWCNCKNLYIDYSAKCFCLDPIQ